MLIDVCIVREVEQRSGIQHMDHTVLCNLHMPWQPLYLQAVLYI